LIGYRAYSIPLQLSLFCTVNEILSLISQNVSRPCDPEHMPFGGSTPVHQSAHDIWSA